MSEFKPSEIGESEDLSPGLPTPTLPPGLASNQRQNQDAGLVYKSVTIGRTELNKESNSD